MKRYWLLFSQTITVLLAAYFVVLTLKPAWLAPRGEGTMGLMQAPALTKGEVPPGSLKRLLSWVRLWETAPSHPGPSAQAGLHSASAQTVPPRVPRKAVRALAEDSVRMSISQDQAYRAGDDPQVQTQ